MYYYIDINFTTFLHYFPFKFLNLIIKKKRIKDSDKNES